MLSYMRWRLNFPVLFLDKVVCTNFSVSGLPKGNVPTKKRPNTKHGCIPVLCLLCFSALEIKKYKWSDLKSNTFLKSNYAAGHALHKRKPYAARKRLREDTQCVVQRWSTQSARGLGRLSPPAGPHAGVQRTGAWDCAWYHGSRC